MLKFTLRYTFSTAWCISLLKELRSFYQWRQIQSRCRICGFYTSLDQVLLITPFIRLILYTSGTLIVFIVSRVMIIFQRWFIGRSIYRLLILHSCWTFLDQNLRLYLCFSACRINGRISWVVLGLRFRLWSFKILSLFRWSIRRLIFWLNYLFIGIILVHYLVQLEMCLLIHRF